MAVAFVKLVPSMYTALRDFFSSSSFFQGKKKEGRKERKKKKKKSGMIHNTYTLTAIKLQLPCQIKYPVAPICG